jgi:hypothetical protein
MISGSTLREHPLDLTQIIGFRQRQHSQNARLCALRLSPRTISIVALLDPRDPAPHLVHL